MLCSTLLVVSFVMVAMINGIVVVYRTVPKQQSVSCKRTFQLTTLSSNAYDSHPRSITVGDLNDDSQPDLIVANTGTDTVGVFLGYENGTFPSQVNCYAGPGSQPYSAVLGDFNNDNRTDIIIANYGINSIGLLIGHGNGTFENVRLYSLGSSRPVSITVADLNNDMHLDVIITSYDISSISILFGYGNASFSIQTPYSTGYDSFPHCVIVADLNKDGQLDLIVANSGTSNIAVFMGYGNELFSYPKIYSTGFGSRPFSIAVGDLNNDNRLDIVVANYGTSTVGTFLGYDNGTFAKMEISFIDSKFHPYSISIADLNKDNIIDVAVANPSNDNIVVLRGLGNGTFTNDEIYSTGLGSSPVSIAISDFNNDNVLDFATANNGTQNMAVMLRYKAKMFTNLTLYSTGINSQPRGVVLGDFNNDSIIDVAVATIQVHVSIFLGYGNGTFMEQISIPEGTGSRPFAITVGDFNNDSLPDLAVTNSGTDNVAILLGFGNGWFGNRTTFSTGSRSNPTSIVVGDFNNDNLLDIAVANYGTDNVGILLGHGNGTFGAQTTVPTGNNSSPVAISLSNFNNDSFADIAVANYGTDNVGILFGHDNGTFGNQMSLATGNNTGPSSLAITDFNNDNILDISVTNFLADNVGVFLGYDTNGSFKQITVYSMGYGSSPISLAFGDFNNDNVTDIAVANYGSNSIGLLFGYGNGTFGMLTIYSTNDGSFPMAIITGNLNCDNWLDIVVTNAFGSSIGVLLGLDNKYVAKQSSYSTGSGSHPYSIAVRDFNNDTLLDLVIVNSGHDNVGIRLGYGNGSFANETTYATEIGSRALYATTGDLNNDNKMDIVIMNNIKDSVTVAFGYGNGTFMSPEIYSTGQGSRPNSAVIGDLNNDSRTDLIILNQGTSTIGVFLSFDYATFKNQSLSSTGVNSSPNSVAVGDFNNDSFLDAVVANFDSSSIGIFLGIGDGAFAKQRSYSTGILSGPYTVTVSDFNQDNILDIAVGNTGTNNVGIFLGYGNGTFREQMTFGIGGGTNPRSIAVCDFNQDHNVDMVVAKTATLAILFGYGNGTFSYNISLVTGTKSSLQSVVVGDFNKDSFPDIAVANAGNNNVGIFLGYGNGTFTGQMTFSTGEASFPISIVVGDFNKDSLLDIAVANNLQNNVGIFLGYGNGSFASQIVYSTGNGSLPIMLSVNYLNNDTNLDIAVADSGSNNVGVFFGYGDGSFTDQILCSTGSGSEPDAIAIGDFNNDYRLDIVVTNNLDGNIMVLLRDTSQPFLSMTTYSTGNESLPQSIAIADFNKDNRLDIVVANYGSDNIGILFGYGNGTLMLQTIYTTGSGSHPCSVAVGDFNNDNLLDIAIANSGTNNVGIFLGYGNGTFSIIKAYQIDNSWLPSSVAVADFNNDKYLDIAVLNAAHQKVLMLFGNGNGTFENATSFLLGYGSVAYSLTAGDLDNDGWVDIAVANYAANSVDIILQQCS